MIKKLEHDFYCHSALQVTKELMDAAGLLLDTLKLENLQSCNTDFNHTDPDILRADLEANTTASNKLILCPNKYHT